MAELIPLFFLVFYIAPFCVAAARAHHSAAAILIVNVLIGWTVIGWFLVFAWAAFGPAQTPQSRARDSRRYQQTTSGGRATMPRILHNFTD